MLAASRRPTRSWPSCALGAKRRVLLALPGCGRQSDRVLKHWRAARRYRHRTVTTSRVPSFDGFPTPGRDDQWLELQFLGTMDGFSFLDGVAASTVSKADERLWLDGPRSKELGRRTQPTAQRAYPRSVRFHPTWRKGWLSACNCRWQPQRNPSSGGGHALSS